MIEYSAKSLDSIENKEPPPQICQLLPQLFAQQCLKARICMNAYLVLLTPSGHLLSSEWKAASNAIVSFLF